MVIARNKEDMDATPPNTEIELKLAVDPEHLTRLRSAAVLKERGRGRAATRVLESVYYDTADFRLKRRAVALRVRKQGNGFIQTVKTAGQATNGVVRGEWEWPLTGTGPDLSKIVEPDAIHELGPLSTSELRPVFESRITRTIRRVDDDSIEVAFDTGELRLPDGTAEPVAELELELKRGQPDALFDLALALNQVVPLRLDVRSKADRGYALAMGEAASWSKAPKLDLAADASVERVMTAIARNCLGHMLVNEACALKGEHPEGIHQMRVALRRLRSAFTLFRTMIPEDQYAWLGGEMRWLASQMGPARDWDVFKTDLLVPVRHAFAEDPLFHADLDELERAAERKRLEGYDTARAAIRSARYTTLVLKLGQWVEARAWRAQPLSEISAMLFQPMTDLAGRLLKRRHKQARRAGASLAEASTEQRHELRIRLKKLRYAVEFFRSLYHDKDTRQYIQQLAALQDVLGHLNDVATARRLLLEVIDGVPGGGEPVKASTALTRAAGLVIGWYGHNADWMLSRDLPGHWAAFCDTKLFWAKR